MTSLFFALGGFGLTTEKIPPSFKMMENHLELPESAFDTGLDRARTASAHRCRISTFSRTLKDLLLLTSCFLSFLSGPFAAAAAPHPQPDRLLFFQGQIPQVPPVRNSSKNKTTTLLSTHSLHTQWNETQWNPGIPYSQKLTWSQSLVRDAGLHSSSFALEEF